MRTLRLSIPLLALLLTGAAASAGTSTLISGPATLVSFTPTLGGSAYPFATNGLVGAAAPTPRASARPPRTED